MRLASTSRTGKKAIALVSDGMADMILFANNAGEVISRCASIAK